MQEKQKPSPSSPVDSEAIEHKNNELYVKVNPEHTKAIVETLSSRIKEIKTQIEQLPNREQIENYKKLENDFNTLTQELMEFFTKAQEIEKKNASLEQEKEKLERTEAVRVFQIASLEETIEYYKKQLKDNK